jgi:integrase
MNFPHVLKRGSVVVKVYRVRRPARLGRLAQTLFTLSWYTGGKRKTMQFADVDAAVEEGRLKLDQLAAGKIDAAAEMTINDADALAEARRIAGSVPLIAALEEWHRARELAGGKLIQAAEAWAAKQGTAYEPETVSVIIDRFLKGKKGAGVKTKKVYKVLEHLREKFGGVQMDAVTPRALGIWVQSRYQNPVYYNTALTRFRTLWAWARKFGYLPKDVQTVADVVDKAREKPNRIGIVRTATLVQLLALVREAHPELIAPLVLAALCGMRSAEVHHQQWDDIDLKGGHVRVTAAKPNTPAFRLVPLGVAAKEWLLLCGDRKERVCRTVVDVEKVRDVAAAAKIALPHNAFRHSYISHAVAASGDINRTALDCGTSPTKVFRNYRQLVTEAEGKDWFTLTPAEVATRMAGKVIDMKKESCA